MNLRIMNPSGASYVELVITGDSYRERLDNLCNVLDVLWKCTNADELQFDRDEEIFKENE